MLRSLHSLRSFPFFIKEWNVLYIHIFRSFEKNGKELSILLGLISRQKLKKRTGRSLKERERTQCPTLLFSLEAHLSCDHNLLVLTSWVLFSSVALSPNFPGSSFPLSPPFLRLFPCSPPFPPLKCLVSISWAGIFERFMGEKNRGRLKSTPVFLHVHKMWHFWTDKNGGSWISGDVTKT